MKTYIDKHDDKTAIFLMHGYDMKCSRIIGSAFSTTLEHILHVRTKLAIFPDALEIKILETDVLYPLKKTNPGRFSISPIMIKPIFSARAFPFLLSLTLF